MIDELKQDLLVQYLLHEVDTSTAEKIRAELESDAELRDFVRETEDAFASMAYAAPPMEPPVGLPQRILQLERNVSRGPSPAPRSKIIWLVLPWALAACLAIACVVLDLERTRLQKENRGKSARNSWRSNRKMSGSKKNWRRSRKKMCLQKSELRL